MEKKILIFEGAGWSKSESSGDVGNCRICSTFITDRNKTIYLELLGVKVHRHMIESLKHYDIAGTISHLFETKDHRTNYSEGLRGEILRTHFEWNKKNILNFVNKRLHCSFDDIEVREDWCGFAVDGNPENDFHSQVGKYDRAVSS